MNLYINNEGVKVLIGDESVRTILAAQYVHVFDWGIRLCPHRQVPTGFISPENGYSYCSVCRMAFTILTNQILVKSNTNSAINTSKLLGSRSPSLNLKWLHDMQAEMAEVPE